MRRLVLTTIVLILFGAGLFNLALPAKESSEQEGVGLSFAIGQEGSPLHIQGTESSVTSGAFSKVTVKNVSDRVVTDVTFAVRAVAKYGGETSIPLLEGVAVQARIEPGATLQLTANVISQQQLDGLARANLGGKLELGVLRARYADGSTWASNVKSTGRFNGKVFAANPYEGLPCAVKNAFARAFLAGIGLRADAGYYTCEGTQNPIYCSNSYTTCAEVICPNPNNCPKQDCRWVPPPEPTYTP